MWNISHELSIPIPDQVSRKVQAAVGREAQKQTGKAPGRYRTPDDIEKDIFDLAGVRIALYFSENQKDVAQFLSEEYDVVKIIPHNGTQNDGEEDYQKRFRGYQAMHFRVRARPKTQLFKDFPTDILEIQVMSIFQQVWADVEHDILYKQLKGNPSLNERRMLDGLNGLMSMGDLQLEQLHHTYQSRITSDQNKMNRFGNEFEVGVVLSSWISRLNLNITTGPVETLFRFLKLPSIGLDTPEKLERLLASLQNEFRISFPGLDLDASNASAVVMHHVISNSSLASSTGPNESLGPKEYSQRCKALISTIILLDELFPPLTLWEPQLTDCALKAEDSHVISSLAWLLGEPAPQMAIRGECELDEDEKSYVDTTWAWVSQHPSSMVRFVFGLARIGLIRDSQHDIFTLDRIWRVLQTILF